MDQTQKMQARYNAQVNEARNRYRSGVRDKEDMEFICDAFVFRAIEVPEPAQMTPEIQSALRAYNAGNNSKIMMAVLAGAFALEHADFEHDWAAKVDCEIRVVVHLIRHELYEMHKMHSITPAAVANILREITDKLQEILPLVQGKSPLPTPERPNHD